MMARSAKLVGILGSDPSAGTDTDLRTMATDTDRGTWVDPRLGRIALDRWAAEFLATSHDLYSL